MINSQSLLSKRGPLGAIRVAAYFFKRLKKFQVQETNISSSVDKIVQNELQVLTYRVLGYLLLGIVRIYSKKVEYLFDDCQEVLIRINDFVVHTKEDMPADVQPTPCFSITLPKSFELDSFDLGILDDSIGGNVLPREEITLKDSASENVGTRQYALDMHLFEEINNSHDSCFANYNLVEDVLSSFRMDVHLRKSHNIDSFTASVVKLQENRFSQEECMDLEIFYAAQEEPQNVVKPYEEDCQEKIKDSETSLYRDVMHGEASTEKFQDFGENCVDLVRVYGIEGDHDVIIASLCTDVLHGEASTEKLQDFGDNGVNLLKSCRIVGDYGVNISSSSKDAMHGEASTEKLQDFGQKGMDTVKSGGIEGDHDVNIASSSKDAIHGEASTEKLQDSGENIVNLVRSCVIEGDHDVNVASSSKEAMHGEASTEKSQDSGDNGVNLLKSCRIVGDYGVDISSSSKDAMHGEASTEKLQDFGQKGVDTVTSGGIEGDHDVNVASSSKEAMHGEASTEKSRESGDNGVNLVRSGGIEGELADHVNPHGEDLQLDGEQVMVSETDQPESETCQVIRQEHSPGNLQAEMDKFRDSTYSQAECMDLPMFSGSKEPQELVEPFVEENHDDAEPTLPDMPENIRSHIVGEDVLTATKLSRTPKIKVPEASGAALPQFTLIPTPAAKERARITRKRKCVFDDVIVLPNKVLKQCISDASDLVSKRRKVAGSALSVWKAKATRIIHHDFFEPLLSCVSSELRSLFSEKNLKIIESAKFVRPPKELDISEIPIVGISDSQQIGIAPETPVPLATLTKSVESPQSPGTPNYDRVRPEPLTISFESPLSPATPNCDRERPEPFQGVCKEPSSLGDQELDLNLIDEVTNSCFEDNNELNGWSGRTRIVARFLHTSFLNQQKRGEEVVNLSQVVKGRTKKESARFFYEILVLNTKGFVDVKQDDAYGDILIRKIPTCTKLLEL